MKLKILYLILFMLLFIPIGLCEKFEDIKELNNIKIYDKTNKIINIYDENKNNIMEIKFISSISDIDKFIEIFEITNFKTYIPNEKKDFITKSNVKFGNNIYKTEFYIYKNISNCNEIEINKTIFNNKTKRNEIIIINKTICFNNKSIWIKYNPYNKTIYKNEKQKIKIIYYKKPELGFFKIQTIPIFRNVKCSELTWWLGNWNLKRPILINNTYGDNVTNYQLKSVNLTSYQINASSTRIINEPLGLQENFWNQSIDSNGNLEYVWCNFSKINNGSWNNNTYYIYYQYYPTSLSVSNGNNTFMQFHNYTINTFLNPLIIYPSPLIFESKFKLIQPSNIMHGLMNTLVYGSGDILEITGCNIGDNYITVRNNGEVSYKQKPPSYIIGVWYNSKIISDNVNVDGYINNIHIGEGSITTNLPDENMGLGFYLYEDVGSAAIDWMFVRKYTINEPELWTVGNIEYPEGLNMTCNLKIITHLTDKKVQIVDMNASIVNENYTNECINLSYDSYIVYMSNPVEISSFTELLNILDNFLIQALLFIFLVIIGTLFYVFIQVVKKKGFKL